MYGDYFIYITIFFYFLAGIMYIALDKSIPLGLLSFLYGISNLIAYIFVRR